jgi:hypothetical protein
MWGEIEYGNMEWHHRKGYFNALSNDSELEGGLAKDVQSKGEKGAKSNLQPINKKQLQATVEGKGQQPSSNIFTAQCSQGCHLLSQLGGTTPSTSIKEEHIHLQLAAAKSNDILYATSKKVSTIHEHDEFGLSNLEREKGKGRNIEEGDGSSS